MVRHILRWGLIAGAIGFVGGYIGAMFAPPAYQGPLLACFTGPMAFALGAIWAGVYWAKMRELRRRTGRDRL